MNGLMEALKKLKDLAEPKLVRGKVLFTVTDAERAEEKSLDARARDVGTQERDLKGAKEILEVEYANWWRKVRAGHPESRNQHSLSYDDKTGEMFELVDAGPDGKPAPGPKKTPLVELTAEETQRFESLLERADKLKKLKDEFDAETDALKMEGEQNWQTLKEKYAIRGMNLTREGNWLMRLEEVE